MLLLAISILNQFYSFTLMEFDPGSCCSICLGEYTTSGPHRVTSLKCGHLFGAECIEKWISLYKKNYCPTCSTPFKKSQLRPIFAVKIVAHEKESEKEFIEKYIKETEARKALEKEVAMLKSQIEMIKSNNKARMMAIQTVSLKIHMHFKKYCKIHFFPNDSKLAFDPINQVILISCFKSGEHGIYKYCISDFTIHSFITFPNRIKCMKISPFGDSLCLTVCENRIYFVNIYSESILKTIPFESNLTAACFCKDNRDQVLVADMVGNLYIVNIQTYHIVKYSISCENIHSVVENGRTIFVATVFGVFSNDYNTLDQSFHQEEIAMFGICTSLTSDMEGNVLALYRDQSYTTTAYILGNRHHYFDPNVKQFSRHDDLFFNGYLFITDDSKDRIKVFDRNTLQMVYSYPFKEKIEGFCGDSNILAVLSKKGVYLYDSKG